MTFPSDLRPCECEPLEAELGNLRGDPCSVQHIVMIITMILIIIVIMKIIIT